jgi:hypothetical protein
MSRYIPKNGFGAKEIETTSIVSRDDGGYATAASEASRWIGPCAMLVVFWALLEFPWEIDPATTPTEIDALVFSELVLALVVWRMLRGASWARYGFSLICACSVIAIVPGLPREYLIFRADFIFSVVECILKLLALTAVGLAYGKKEVDGRS